MPTIYDYERECREMDEYIISLMKKGGEKMSGTIVVKNAVERKPGYLYYIDGEGNLMESKMMRRKKKAVK